MKRHSKYNGVVVPTVTPLTADFKFDQEAFEKMVTNFRQHNTMPFILGTTGESASLPFSLKLEYIKFAGSIKQPGEVYYAGIASNVLEESVALAHAAFEAGIDVVAANLPSYYALTEKQMFTYFEHLADQVQGPLIIYNIPATTHMSIPLHVLDKLSQHLNIVGVKDSERSEERLQESLELWADREDFCYFLGWAAQSAEALFRGADGLIPSTGNFIPGIYQDMLRAVDAGDREKAFHYQRLSDAFGALYQSGRTLGESLWGLKKLIQETGLCQPYMMSPLSLGTHEEGEMLKQNLHDLLRKEGIQL
ncbi:dihydrodipicolinate synthase family protein [Botryobacter ruber]|uniref:dihydrodipicolinate synthase family protein n=1 Tax=Botryobacter ruber TaxID=2171629 RepID=UPI000E0AA13E|nr:dihydrodipicolinate synthase family protein [Botryobacter ruber]